jgi:Flp pilus assembly protein TadG
VIVGLSCVVLVPVIGLGIDGASLYLIRARLSHAADAAALAGARSLNTGADVASQRASATAVAAKYFAANFPAGYWSTNNGAVSVAVAEDNQTRARTVTVAAGVDAPLYFMRMIDSSRPRIQVTAVGRRRDVNVMLVLDRSGSMIDGNAIAPMQDAAVLFVQSFAGGRDKLGLVTYGGTYYLAYPPSANFKSASPNVETLVRRIVGGGNTNTSQALSIAYQQLVSLGEPGALNVILLFTDGVPTAFTGDFNGATLSSSTTCWDKSGSRVGFVADWNGGRDPGTTVGVLRNTASSLYDVSENNLASNSYGCQYTSNFNRMKYDIARMPTLDIYGNATTAGYRSVNLSRPDLPSQVSAAASNAADSAARRIRNDTTYKPVIYTIGLGGTSSNPPDQTLLRRIANDSTSPVYNENEPTGLFVWSPTTAQLQAAFLRIASEILRLSQ